MATKAWPPLPAAPLEPEPTRWVRVRVHGGSMWPTLRDGDTVWVDRHAYASAAPAVGDVVLVAFERAASGRSVKRVTQVAEDGRLWLEGDTTDPTASTDSHDVGWFAAEAVEGRVHAGDV